MKKLVTLLILTIFFSLTTFSPAVEAAGSKNAQYGGIDKNYSQQASNKKSKPVTNTRSTQRQQSVVPTQTASSADPGASDLVIKKPAAGWNILTGIALGDWPEASKGNIEYSNNLLNTSAKVIHTFVNTNQDIDEWIAFMDYVREQDAVNLLTLETKKSDYSDYSTTDINKGLLDAYFARIAGQLKGWGDEVWLRPLHEGNGNWYGWAIGDSSVNTNASYKQAFQRIVKIFRDNGADNVKFIYNVNCENIGRGASFMGAYPGDGYVDYVSIDGYNWGTAQSWGSKWKSFNDIFVTPYQALVEGSDRPVIIAEYASTEIGGNKAAWIADAKEQMNSGVYKELVAAVWFNVDKETDWRIQSSPSSLTAYKN